MKTWSSLKRLTEVSPALRTFQVLPSHVKPTPAATGVGDLEGGDMERVEADAVTAASLLVDT
jgi:hypothetical protein